MSTFKFLAPIKPRYLRRSRRSQAARVESFTLPQARDACAAFACRLRRDGFSNRFTVTCDLAPADSYSTDSLVDAVDAARHLFESNQLAAHHLAVTRAIALS